AAGYDERPLSIADHVCDLIDAGAVGSHARGECTRRSYLAFDLGVQDVERDVDEHRTGPAGNRGLVRLIERVDDRVRTHLHPGPLGDRTEQIDDVLEAVVA